MIDVLSCGLGVQSTTILLLAEHGVLRKPSVSFFSDTECEPLAVYEHKAWLTSGNVISTPLVTIGIGNLYEEIMAATRGESTRGSHARPPVFVLNPDGSHGMVRRQCTGDYKIDPVQKAIRGLLELKPRAWWPKDRKVNLWLGISTDEADRMSASKIATIEHYYPLIELGMSRQDCIDWLKAHDYPVPPKSACIMCPYQSEARWAWMKENSPAEFEKCCVLDEAIRKGLRGPGLGGELFLHRSRTPLRSVDFSLTARQRRAKRTGQDDLFSNNCGADGCGT